MIKNVIISLLLAFVLTGNRSLAQLSLDPSLLDTLAKHIPGSGFRLIKSKIGTLEFSPYVSLRYLNQMATDDNYVDDFGRRKSVDLRNDFQMHKIMLYFRGWLFDP